MEPTEQGRGEAVTWNPRERGLSPAACQARHLVRRTLPFPGPLLDEPAHLYGLTCVCSPGSAHLCRLTCVCSPVSAHLHWPWQALLQQMTEH